MSRLLRRKTSKRKKWYGNSTIVCIDVAEHQILGGKHFLILGPESGKIWWLKKVQCLQKKYHCQWTLCVARNPSGFFTISAIFCVHWSSVPASRERVVPTEWQVRTVLGDCISRAKVIPAQAPQYRQHALISDFLDLANLSVQEEAALATNWIKDRPEGLKLQNLALATRTGRSTGSLPESLTADVHYAINKCESLGSGRQLILHGNPSAIARDFSPYMAVLRRHFLPNVHFQCCMLLQGTLGHDFDIFAASGESTAWVLLWKTRSRPIGVRVCPVAQFDFFSTAFDPREWTMVVFWKEDSGRQLRLITPENEER